MRGATGNNYCEVASESLEFVHHSSEWIMVSTYFSFEKLCEFIHILFWKKNHSF